MKIPLTISLVFFSCLKVLSLNVDFENKVTNYLIVKQNAKKCSIVGLLTGIIDNANTFTPHYGYTDLRNNHIGSDSKLFPSASISKLFTATTIIQFVKNNKFGPIDKLIEILTEFKIKDKRYGRIEIKHLLTYSFELKPNSALKKSSNDTSAVLLYIQNLQNKKLKFSSG